MLKQTLLVVCGLLFGYMIGCSSGDTDTAYVTPDDPQPIWIACQCTDLSLCSDSGKPEENDCVVKDAGGE